MKIHIEVKETPPFNASAVTRYSARVVQAGKKGENLIAGMHNADLESAKQNATEAVKDKFGKGLIDPATIRIEFSVVQGGGKDSN